MHSRFTAHASSLLFAGHSGVLLFCFQVVGAVGLELWVESSGPDADVFAYLEDIDLKGNIRSPPPSLHSRFAGRIAW